MTAADDDEHRVVAVFHENEDGSLTAVEALELDPDDEVTMVAVESGYALIRRLRNADASSVSATDETR
jgi:hypothetical protein